MTIDLYTKSVLTVIAACLVYLCLGGPSLLTPVEAQIQTPMEVVISGWKYGREPGTSTLTHDRGLPVTVVNR
jgi:hypothetical protein